LHWAAEKNNFDLVKFLIENGASPDALNKDGKTPGFYAKDSEVKRLLNAGKYILIEISPEFCLP
jgi:ankyrin repeat protein